MTLKEARKRVAESKGARERELAARYLLLHLDRLEEATAGERDAFLKYVEAEEWRGLYGHDRGMYRLLRRQAELYSTSQSAI